MFVKRHEHLEVSLILFQFTEKLFNLSIETMIFFAMALTKFTVLGTISLLWNVTQIHSKSNYLLP